MRPFIAQLLNHNCFPNSEIRIAYQFFASHDEYIIKSLYEYQYIDLTLDISDLFSRVTTIGRVPENMLIPGEPPWENSKQFQETCYWLAIEPFRFFMDLDFSPNSKTNIDEMIPLFKDKFDFFLVCKHQPWSMSEENEKQRQNERISESVEYDPDKRESYTIFTDRLVYYEEAKKIEYELAMSSSYGWTLYKNFFTGKPAVFPKSPVDCVFFRSAPFSYRRSPYSFSYLWHSSMRPYGGFRNRQSIPDVELSHLPNNINGPLEYFKFSYINAKLI